LIAFERIRADSSIRGTSQLERVPPKFTAVTSTTDHRFCSKMMADEGKQIDFTLGAFSS
jgi:hypothetical protein